MSTVAELEKQLADAKLQETVSKRQAELEKLQETYEGKAFGTHTFERNSRSVYMGGYYYERFWLNEKGLIMVKEWTFTLNRSGKDYVFSSKNLNFSRQIAERQLSDAENKYHAEYNLRQSHYLGTIKEISIAKFQEIWGEAEASWTDFLLALKNKPNELPEYDLLRVGTSGEENKMERIAGELQLDMLDVMKFPVLYNTLQYLQLPFYYEQRWIPSIYVKRILEYQISKWKDELNNPFIKGHAIEWNNRRIKILGEFLQEHPEFI